ncbi:hypothetical protein [Oryzibacter oryziterrae]|uniref:hypothetical protein n=1 Tax=Oryzibacter oryziterrae TaxID=2766474 RepID=UPI001F34734E|nr:hypothetical protein [Oryzibacter oryziterrae]
MTEPAALEAAVTALSSALKPMFDAQSDELARTRLDLLDLSTKLQPPSKAAEAADAQRFEAFKSDVLKTIAFLAQRLDRSDEMVRSLVGQMGGVIETVSSVLQEVVPRIQQDVRNEAADLRQTANLLARTRPVPAGQRIRCVFLVHAIESWDAQVDLYEAMRDDARFDPIVASINRHFPGDAGFAGEDRIHEELERAGVPHIRLGMANSFQALDILRALAPDVIFRQSQWCNDLPPAFHASRLNFARICSVPYGTSIVERFSPNEQPVNGVSEQSFDLPYHRLAWRIFCETEQTRDFLASFQHGAPDKFVVTGYPKLFRLLKGREETDAWPIRREGKRGYRVIWAPHHSVLKEWLGFAVFHKVYLQFLNWAVERPDIEFVLKPHPSLFSQLVSKNILRADELDRFLNRWNGLPNCCVETGRYGGLFAASDLMITDGLSFLTEYQIFDKPLIFQDSRHHVPFNALGNLAVEAAHVAHDFEAMRAAVEAYAAGAPWGYEEARARLRKVLFPAERPATELVLDEIANGIGAG